LALVELVELRLDPLLLEMVVILYLGLLLQLVEVAVAGMMFHRRLLEVRVEVVVHPMEQIYKNLAVQVLQGKAMVGVLV
jgi:hypothetical protein